MSNSNDTEKKAKQNVATLLTYEARELQDRFHDSGKRWSIMVCHRRFGKTVMAVNHLINAALKNGGSPNRRYAYIAPTYRHGKTMAWDYLKRFSRVKGEGVIMETELRVDYSNGSQIRIFGADNPDSLRGIYLDGVFMDEYDLMPANLFGEIIRPALADRAGFAVFMGTPKGRQKLWSLFSSRKNDPKWYVALHKASETGIISEQELLDARDAMSEAQYAQEFECSFEASMNGDIFKREYWKYYVEKPMNVKRILHSWDTAFKTGGGSDFTAGIMALECETGYYITNVFRQKLAFPELKRNIRSFCDSEKPNVVLIEDKGSGQSLIQELKHDTAIPVLAVQVDSDKVTRAHAASPMVEAGNVYLPDGAPWLSNFVEECAGFPNGTHDDQVDALTQLINWARHSTAAPTVSVRELGDCEDETDGENNDGFSAKGGADGRP